MEERFARLLSIGYRHARQTGLCHDVAEDCATEFLEHMLEDKITPAIASMYTWEHVCAHHFALNYRRKEGKHAHDCVWQELAIMEENAGYPACSSHAEDPLDAAIRHEFWEQVQKQLSSLPAYQQTLFARHHVNGETVLELAQSLNKTPGSIEQALWRLRQRLRLLMNKENLTPGE